MEKTFIENEQSKVEITNVFEKTDEASSLFTNISDEVVKAYTSDLDKLLVKIKEKAVENTPSDNILEKLVMELSNILYFMGTRLESVGIKDDITKLSAKEVYNNSSDQAKAAARLLRLMKMVSERATNQPMMGQV